MIAGGARPRPRLRQLGSVARGLRGKLAHQPVQSIDVSRQCGEIEIHDMPPHNNTHCD
jgi:hypothetical protein